MCDEGPEACQQLFARRHVSFQPHPRARPVVQIAAVGGSIGGRRHRRTPSPERHGMAAAAIAAALVHCDTPLALIGAAHFSISLAVNLPRYSGLRRSGATIMAPRPCKRSRTDGVFIAATVVSLSFLTISAGVPLGR